MKVLNKWLNILELTGVKTEAILPQQVTYPDDLKLKEFIGVDIKQKIIYHTRPLTENDIVHELLHIKLPNVSEKDINFLTKILTTKNA